MNAQIQEIRERQKLLQGAIDEHNASSEKLGVPQRALAEVHRVISGADQLIAAFTEVDAQRMVDADSVTTDEFETASRAANAAKAEADIARSRIPALERAIELLKTDNDAKAQAIGDRRRNLHAQIAAWLKTRARSTFSRYEAAVLELQDSIAEWNAHDELIEVVQPPAHPPMRFTGLDGFVAIECQGGPDQNGFRTSDRPLQRVRVTPARIESQKTEIRAELAQAGVRI
jgi:hypothetical protein